MPARGAVAAHTISFANLDGSGGGDLSDASGNGDHDLDVGGTPVGLASGIALDPDAGRLYWIDDTGGGSIASASLSGQGGARLLTAGATFSGPSFLALLRSPRPAGPPAITGAAQLAVALSARGRARRLGSKR